MKPHKADIDFLINQKKRASQRHFEGQDFELPDNLSSDDFDPQEGLPDSDINLFSKKIAEREASAPDEDQVQREEIELTSAAMEKEQEKLEFDINDALILPEFKEETPPEENRETADFSESPEVFEQSSHQELPFILEPSSQESEDNLDDIQLTAIETETPTENTREDSKEENAQGTLNFSTRPKAQFEVNHYLKKISDGKLSLNTSDFLPIP